ncbi:MAG: iron ABC transporter permease [Candidatus Omnitrophica bacterium]|nr:iron ABC transporter permease [Candidatus Omnitrophota bacterium]
MNRHLKRKIFILFIILAMAVLLGIFKGSVNISFDKLFLKENQPILYLRIFRILTAIIAGGGLAVSGIVLQSILRNSLAEPYLLGTSSGAGLGAVIALVIGVSRIYLPAAAFIGAMLSIILVYALARQNNKIPEQSLILAGVIVSVALSAIIVFLVSISGDEALHGLTWWLWGSFQVYDFKLLFAVTLIVVFGVLAVYIFAQDLNAISTGEEEAVHLGIDVESTKKILLLITSLITASLVCICGIIGFVGLMIPHMMRMIVGPNHKILIPTSVIAAAIFMVACDTISRTIFPPLEIPIGVITAILGAPVFIILLKRKQRAK